MFIIPSVILNWWRLKGWIGREAGYGRRGYPGVSPQQPYTKWRGFSKKRQGIPKYYTFFLPTSYLCWPFPPSPHHILSLSGFTDRLIVSYAHNRTDRGGDCLRCHKRLIRFFDSSLFTPSDCNLCQKGRILLCLPVAGHSRLVAGTWHVLSKYLPNEWIKK